MNQITTITINDKTKEDLLKVAAQLQIKRRKKINYDTTIKFLIDNYQKKKNKEQFYNACKKIENVDVDEVLSELYQERRKDEVSL